MNTLFAELEALGFCFFKVKFRGGLYFGGSFNFSKQHFAGLLFRLVYCETGEGGGSSCNSVNTVSYQKKSVMNRKVGHGGIGNGQCLKSKVIQNNMKKDSALICSIFI